VLKRWLAGLTGLALMITAALIAVTASPAAAAPVTRVLVFSKTAGFRHSSIPNGIAAIRQLGTQNGFAVVATEDANQFTTANLAQYQAVIWLSTTGDVLNATQQTAFESYIASGGGYVGIHAAADTEYDWPFYGGLVGAYFLSHPAIQQATVRLEDASNVATAHLPQSWARTDEWYNYRANPRSNVHVLLRLDEATYSGGSMGDHPITWCQNYRGGRAFYTGLGHTEASYTESNFTRMVLGGIQFAGGAVVANCSPPTAPAGTALRSRANNRFVTSGAGNLIASATTAGTNAERFDIVTLTGSNIALRSRANNMFVTAANNGNSPLIANRPTAATAETFTRVNNSDGTVSFRAVVNNRYVVAENAGAAALIANRTAIGTWEKFDLVTG